MKKNISSYINAIIEDNKQYIAQSDMTIAEYIIENADNNDTRYCEFFDECEFEDNDTFEPTDKQIEDFKKWLNDNYDFKVE